MEPDVEKPPVRVQRDWWFAAAVAGIATAEVLVRGDMVGRPLALVLGWALALASLWRRTHPLAMVGLGFGGLVTIDLASVVVDGEPVLLYAAASVLVLVYSVFRWGTSSQAATGLLVVLMGWFVTVSIDFTGITDATGGLVALLFFAALGVSVRYRRIVRTQQFERVRFRERRCSLASCTTPSRITYRPSPSRPRPGDFRPSHTI